MPLLLCLALGLADAAPPSSCAPHDNANPDKGRRDSGPARPPEVRRVRWKERNFTVVEVHLDGMHRMDLFGQGDGAPRTIDAAEGALRDEGREMLAATNAGMYRPNRRPVGLHIERGQLHSPVVRGASGGNFGLLPNGIFYVDDTGAHIVTTPEWRLPAEGIWLATQSGPILVRAGNVHPEFREASPSLNLRSGVGVHPDGRVFLAISDGGVRFHEFATLFRDELGCPDALYLDGVVSTLVVEGRDGVENRVGHYSGVLTVSRPEGSAP